jgi:hypothetical protein
MTSQTSLSSLIESVVNVFTGMIINLIAQIVIFPIYGIKTTIQTNIQIVGIFTILAIIRTYSLRRIFNKGIK